MQHRTPLLAFCAAAAVPAAHAAIVVQAHYPAGEAGTINANGYLQDTSGNARHFTNGAAASSDITASTTSPAPNSTAYASDSNTATFSGIWGADWSTIPNDNVVMELWARATNLNDNTAMLMSDGGNGALKIGIDSGNWNASIHNAAWVGAANGTGQPVTAGAWTHLAVIRENGTSTLYIDGVAQAGTTGSAPVFDQGHAFTNVGGFGGSFDGDIDEPRVFTFDPNTDDPIANLLINVPEPASAALALLGVAAIASRRRRV